MLFDELNALTESPEECQVYESSEKTAECDVQLHAVSLAAGLKR